MNQVFIISIAVLAGVLLAGAAALKVTLTQVMRLHFGIERGQRDREARRRFKAFEWCCWNSYSCVSAAFSLQDLREPPFTILADLSGIVVPTQVALGLVAIAFAVAAFNRFREPFAY